MARPASESSLPFPPYGSFISFLNDLNAMEVLPNRLNQQVFSNSYSGSARYQIIRGFKFFALVRDDNAFEEENLQQLLNPDTRSVALAQLLQDKYSGLVGLPLATAGPAEVNKWFNDQGMDAATTAKAKSFFTAAAKANGIKMHPLVVERSARGGGSGPRKVRRPSKTKPANAALAADVESESQKPTPPATSEILFHPAIDAFLRSARGITEGDRWTAAARDGLIAAFTNQLDLFLPVANTKLAPPRKRSDAAPDGAAES